MAKTSQKINLKRWKRKFLGINEEGADITDDVYSKAQRLINIFRQLSVLNKDAIEKYNDMLLNVSSDVRSVLSTLPCGMDVRGYISYLQERRGLPIEEDDDEDDEEMLREKEKAKIMADAISQSTTKSAEAMQRQTMENMEKLSKALAEAQSRSASPEEIARIAMSMQTQGGMPGMSPVASAPMVPAAIPMMRRAVKEGEEGEDSVVYYQDSADVAGSIGKAVADAIVQSQRQTSEIISGMLADALSRPQQLQNDSLKEISEMLANSQEKTANIILASFGEAISRPQQVQNEGIRELASTLMESNRKTAEVITSSIADSITALTSRTDERIKAIAGSMLESNRDMIEAVNNSVRAALSKPEEYENETIGRMANLIAASQEQTARVVLDAFGACMNRPEERRNDEIRLLTDVVARAVELLSQPHPTSDDMMRRFLEAQERNSATLAKVIETLTGVKEEPPADEEPVSEDNELSEPLYGSFDESEFRPVAPKQSEFFEIDDDGRPMSFANNDGGYNYNDETAGEYAKESLDNDSDNWANDSLVADDKDYLSDYSSFFAGDSGFMNEQRDDDLMQIIPELPVVKTKKKTKAKQQESSADEVEIRRKDKPAKSKKSAESASVKSKTSSSGKTSSTDVSENDEKKDFWVKNKSKKNHKKGGVKPFVMLPDSESGGFTKVELG